ncbi:ParA family protein [Sutterella sp.]|uniref:ParA family protein n=1 Tax=Sutterella sp. TaxID=1981025 RepID=UPI0026DF3B09|nr:ParA family protein [Sutterella sp.]MDO5532275.1 ParA family protein [Sutterella sp.]
MHTIAIANRKGGVGKSTTAAVLAHGLAQRGHRVLCVDLDSQCNLTQIIGIGAEATSLTDLLLDVRRAVRDSSVQSATVPVPYAGKKGSLDLLPGDPDLSRVEIELVGDDRTEALRRLLESVQSDYDYCVIDSAPSLGLLPVMALVAAQHVLIPMTADRLSLQGLRSQLEVIEDVKSRNNPTLNLLGVLLTARDGRTTLEANAEQILRAQAETAGFRVFTPIPRTVLIREAQANSEHFLSYAPKSKAAAAYKQLVRDIEKMTGRKD